MSGDGPLWSGDDPARRPRADDEPVAPEGWLPPTDAPPPPGAFEAPSPVPAPPPAAPTAGQHDPYASWPGAGPRTVPAVTDVADYSARAGAAAVDFFVRLAILLAATAVGALGYTAGTDAGETAIGIAQIVGGVIAYAYAPIMIARTGGQTVGHRATHTRIVRRDGSPLTGGGAVVRELLVKGVVFEFLGVLLLLVPALLNYLWPLWDENNEALHDKICSTRVVRA